MQETMILLEPNIQELVQQATRESSKGWRTLNMQVGIPTQGGGLTNALLMVRTADGATAEQAETITLENQLPPELSARIQQKTAQSGMEPLRWIAAKLEDALDEYAFNVRVHPETARGIERLAVIAGEDPGTWAGSMLAILVGQTQERAARPTEIPPPAAAATLAKRRDYDNGRAATGITSRLSVQGLRTVRTPHNAVLWAKQTKIPLPIERPKQTLVLRPKQENTKDYEPTTFSTRPNTLKG